MLTRSKTSPFILLLILILGSCKPDNEGKYVQSSLQFANSGFEQLSHSQYSPGWKLVPEKGYTVSKATDDKHGGTYSLKITCNPLSETDYINLSQKLPVKCPKIKRIRISAYVKTRKFSGSVVMWYQIWDKHNKQIDFENSEGSGVMATGTTNWQKYSMDLTLNQEAKYIVFGAFVKGKGTAWFDDFTIDSYEGATAQAKPNVVQANNEFLNIVKQNSIYKDSINWKSLEEDLAYLGKGLKTSEDVTILNNYVLKQLRKAGDYHSFIQSKIAVKNYAEGNARQVEPEGFLLPGDLAYIKVPGFGSVNQLASEKFALQIQKLIRDTDLKNNVKGWVVDLRTNTGGNMYPMLTGLGPLLDVGTIGYFVIGGKEYPWKYTENGIGVNVANPYKIKQRDAKIAVLIGSETGSSGEMCAIAFIGRKNTKLFGQATAGYVTSNQMFKLSDGSELFLATGYSSDRNHKKYTDKIYPDITVDPVSNRDETLQQAKSWLKEK